MILNYNGDYICERCGEVLKDWEMITCVQCDIDIEAEDDVDLIWEG